MYCIELNRVVGDCRFISKPLLYLYINRIKLTYQNHSAYLSKLPYPIPINIFNKIFLYLLYLEHEMKSGGLELYKIGVYYN